MGRETGANRTGVSNVRLPRRGAGSSCPGAPHLECDVGCGAKSESWGNVVSTQPGERAPVVAREDYLIAVGGLRRPSRHVAAALRLRGYRVLQRGGAGEPNDGAQIVAARPSLVLVCGDPTTNPAVRRLLTRLDATDADIRPWVTVLSESTPLKRPFAALRLGADEVLPLNIALLDEFTVVLDRRLARLPRRVHDVLWAAPLRLVPAELRVMGPELNVLMGSRQFWTVVLIIERAPEVATVERLAQHLGRRTGTTPSVNVLHKTVSRVRRRLGCLGELIVTVRGVGYRYEGTGLVTDTVL